MRTAVVTCLALGACAAPFYPPAHVAGVPASQPPLLDVAHRSCERLHATVLPGRASADRQGSAVALVRSGTRLFAYVADADSRSIHTVSVDEHRELARTRLAGAPREVLVMADGRVVTTLADGTRFAVLEPDVDPAAPFALLCEREVPAEPSGLALSRDDAKLLVTSAWGHALSVFDASTFIRERTVPLPRDPRSVLVDDAGVAFVSHLVGAKMSAVDLEDPASQPFIVDLAVRKSSPRASLTDKLAMRTGSQGYALAKVGLPANVAGAAGLQRVLAPMVSVDPGDPVHDRAMYYGPPFDGVAKESPIVSVVDPATRQTLSKFLLATTDSSVAGKCLLPRAATVRARTRSLLVACAGTDALLELDALAVDPFRAERRRFTVPAGPEGVAVDDATGTAVVFSQLGAALTVIHLDPIEPASVTAASLVAGPAPIAVESIALDYHPDPALDAAARGRALFYRTDDSRIADDGLACASCHIDGRDDAITWSTLLGARQTPMLAGRLEGAAPYGWEGKRATLPVYIASTISNLGGSGLTASELDELAEYLLVAPGPPDDASADERLVRRGHELFDSSQQGCGSCHINGQATDAATHDLTASHEAFDTPTLRFIRGSAPYFHDGRYATLEELLADPSSSMGHSASLPHADRAALAAYLRSL